MAKLKRIGQFLLDVIEIYIPSISFTVMFVVFIFMFSIAIFSTTHSPGHRK